MKIIYVVIFAVVLSTSLNAQVIDEQKDRGDRQERIQSRIESQKVAYITQKLDLTPSEAQQFWPIYNEFQGKMKDFRRQYKLNLEDNDLSEKDANLFLANLLNREQEELDLKKSYFEKLKSVVTVQKVAKLYVIENKFREKILAKIKNKMGQKRRKMSNRDF